MDTKAKSIPMYAIVIALILVGAIIFLFTVQIPFSQKIPTYNAQHASATAEIEKYKDYNRRYDQVRADIDRMQKEYNEKGATLFVEPNKTVDEIKDMLEKLGYDMTTLSVSEGAPDGAGRISATGDPLYATQISYTFTATRTKMIETLQYFESEAKGSYAISKLSLKPIEEAVGGSTEEGEESAPTKVITKNDQYQVTMSIVLYYFNNAMNKGLPTQSSAASA